MGKLLHLCEVVRPGKFFVRGILNQLGLAPLKAGEDAGTTHFVVGGKYRRGCVCREFHEDLVFWRKVVAMATRSDGITRLEAPLLRSFSHGPSRTLVSDASADGIGGFSVEAGQWLRIDCTDDFRARLHSRVIFQVDMYADERVRDAGHGSHGMTVDSAGGGEARVPGAEHLNERRRTECRSLGRQMSGRNET